jgi:anthranilate synthase component 1
MELIAELEPTARGPYAGAVGYCTFAGDLDFCITIRTAVVADGRAHVQTGAGIVADSDPDGELAETKAKAAALLPAILDAEGVWGGQEASERKRASVAPQDDEAVR